MFRLSPMQSATTAERHDLPRRRRKMTRAVRRVDLDRAIAALKAAGCEIAGVRVNPETGQFIVVTTAGQSLTEETEEQRLDRELEQHRGKHGHGSA